MQETDCTGHQHVVGPQSSSTQVLFCQIFQWCCIFCPFFKVRRDNRTTGMLWLILFLGVITTSWTLNVFKSKEVIIDLDRDATKEGVIDNGNCYINIWVLLSMIILKFVPESSTSLQNLSVLLLSFIVFNQAFIESLQTFSVIVWFHSPIVKDRKHCYNLF